MEVLAGALKKEKVTIGEHYQHQLSLLPHTLILGSECGCNTTITADLPRGNKEQILTISLHDKGRFGLNKYLISSSKMLPRIPVFVFIRGCTKRQLWKVILLGNKTSLTIKLSVRKLLYSSMIVLVNDGHSMTTSVCIYNGSGSKSLNYRLRHCTISV